jgi:hypothetical protein
MYPPMPEACLGAKSLTDQKQAVCWGGETTPLEALAKYANTVHLPQTSFVLDSTFPPESTTATLVKDQDNAMEAFVQ